MASTATEIKNVMTSHLRRGLFGMEIYGQHEISMGLDNPPCIIEVHGASRFERYGVVIVYHPTFGKWQAALLSARHCGRPALVLSADEIRANIARIPSQDFIYKVYGGEKPNTTIEQAQSQLIREAVIAGLTPG